MGTYMVQASYTADAWATLCKQPEDRSVEVAKQMEAFGGKLLSFYYCFGDYDVVVTCEAPDDVAIMGAVAGAISAGHVKSTKTTKLLLPNEAMDAMGQAGKRTFASPSG